MKKISIFGLFVLIVIQLSFAQISYEIAPWHNQKKAAIVLTFDDWTTDHPNFVVPELLKRELTGTFYVNEMRSFESVKTAYKNGIEIGNHTKSHPDLTKKDDQALKIQIEDFDVALNKQLSRTQTATFAYPFGTGVENSKKELKIREILAKNFVAARGVYPIQNKDDIALTYDFAKTEDDYYKLKVGPVSDGIKNYMERISWVEEKGGMLVHMYHGTMKGLYDVVPENDFKEQLDSLKAHKNLWVTSLEKAVKYHRERKTATLKEISSPENDVWILQLHDELDDNVYQQELTVVLDLPKGKTSVRKIRQTSKSLDFWWEGDKLVFNVIPDKGNIVIYLASCDAPKIDVKALTSTTICLGQKVGIETIFDKNYTYQWIKDGRKIQGKTKSSEKFEKAGNYQVQVSKGDCILMSHQVISINTTGICGEPKAKIDINKQEIYTNQLLEVNNFTTNLVGNEKYEWILPKDAIFIEGSQNATKKENIKIEFEKEGEKTISLKVIGEKKTDIISVNVKVVEPTKYVYQENFNGPFATMKIAGWNDYEYGTGKGTLNVKYSHIRTNEWYSFEHTFGGNGIDFSIPQNTPVVKIRMRATDTVTISVFMIDKYNIATVGMMHNTRALLDVTPEFKEYTIDFSNIFFDQWNKRTLDTTQIMKLRFGANFGHMSFPFTNSFGQKITTGFVGTLEVDWLGIGRDAEFPSMISLPEEVCINEKILVDYYLSGEKHEWILSDGIKREGNYIWAEKPMKAKIEISSEGEKVKESMKFIGCEVK